MFVKNFLTSGDFLTVVPVGYPMTIQYDVNGTIERVYKWWGDTRVELPKEVLHQIMKRNTVPRSVALKNGSTLVAGVLYTADNFKGSGTLPDCVMDEMLEMFLSGEGAFNFFAGSVESHSSVFHGSAQTRQWLTFSKFNVLPGVVIPYNCSEDQFEQLLNKADYPFKYPLISNYIYFKNGQPEFHSVGLVQRQVMSVHRTTSHSGWILGEVEYTDGTIQSYNYAEICKYNIHSGSIVVSHEEGKIIYSYSNSNEVVDREIECEFCGKKIRVPEAFRVRCDDPHCNSRLFTETRNLLKAFNLPAISYDSYFLYSSQVGNEYAPVDILDAPEYNDAAVKVSIQRILEAGTLSELNIPSDAFKVFCNRCNNKISTIEYYLQNPARIAMDLGLDSHQDLHRWAQWLNNNPSDMLDIISLLHHEKITISNTDKKYEGAPIFRGRTLLITGDFNHGNMSEISAVLSSYDGSVITDWNPDADCIIVGDRQENVNGSIIRHARELNIPIFTESEFFSKYKIDDDLAQNL